MNSINHGMLFGINIKTNIDLPVMFPFVSDVSSNEKEVMYHNECIDDLEDYDMYAHNERKYVFYRYNRKKEAYMIETEMTGNVVVNRNSIHYYSDNFNNKHAYLLSFGMGLAMMLRLNGFVVFHANSLSLNGHTLMVMGPSGAGKSTLCSNLVKNYGAELISDDMTCINVQTNQLYTGFPVMKLWPSTLSEIFQKKAMNYKTVGGNEKVYFPICNHSKAIFHHADRVVILQPSENNATIENMSTKQLLCKTIKHIYNKPSLDNLALCSEMNSIVNIITSNNIKGYLVNNPHSYESLNGMCDKLVYSVLQ